MLLPGGYLIIERARFEASVQDADESVGEPAESGVVADVTGSLAVVVSAGSG